MISLLPCSVRWRYQLAGPSQIKSHNRYLWIWIQKFEAEEKVFFFFCIKHKDIASVSKST